MRIGLFVSTTKYELLRIYEYMENKEFISMAEAANLCTYDQEYLSLLSRRGLLQAEKIGKKWYTTREWLNNYLRENRPNEVIAQDKKRVKEIKNLISLPQAFRWLFITILAVAIVGFFSYQYAVQRINKLEQKASDNKFILNEIIKIPDDEGNLDVYGSGRVKMNKEFAP